MSPRVLALGMLVGAWCLHPPLAAPSPVPSCHQRAPGQWGEGSARCLILCYTVPAGMPGCPCTPAVSPVLSPGAVSSVAAGEPGEGPCHACPAALGFTSTAAPALFITRRLWRVSVPHSAAPAVPERALGHQHCHWGGFLGPFWGAAAALCGDPWLVLWGPCSVYPVLWGTPMPQSSPWQCQPQGSGGRAAVPAAQGGSIISAVTHVLITENGLISLRLEVA